MARVPAHVHETAALVCEVALGIAAEKLTDKRDDEAIADPGEPGAIERGR